MSGFDAKRRELAQATRLLRREGRALLDGPASELSRAAASLDALSPLKVLARGYGIAYGDGGVATSAASFTAGDSVRVRFADGDIFGTVERTQLSDTANDKE